ncbi:MAG: two-component system sensor histidine kinase HupT/HoxJ [Candidatus Krumholzibacteriia bacterium]
MLNFLGFISVNVALAAFLGVVILLLMVQSMRLNEARREAQIAAASLLEQEQLTALGRMVAGIAHELNTPLSAMSSSVGTQKKAAVMMDAAVAEMSAPGVDPAESLAKCDKALRALRASEEVVDLAVTRTTQLVRVLRLAGRGENDETQPVDVNVMIKDSILLLGHELKSGVSVTLNLGQVKTVPGWPGALGQVVLNLVQNARQALGDSGVITVTSEMRADKVVIIVSDDGPGLPSGCSQKLFKPGFTTKTAANGTGLGLYISGNIVRRHNGEINASNRPEGGAEFVITLPSTA